MVNDRRKAVIGVRRGDLGGGQGLDAGLAGRPCPCAGRVFGPRLDRPCLTGSECQRLVRVLHALGVRLDDTAVPAWYPHRRGRSPFERGFDWRFVRWSRRGGNRPLRTGSSSGRAKRSDGVVDPPTHWGVAAWRPVAAADEMASPVTVRPRGRTGARRYTTSGLGSGGGDIRGAPTDRGLSSGSRYRPWCARRRRRWPAA